MKLPTIDPELDGLAFQIRRVFIALHRNKETAFGKPSNWNPGSFWDGGEHNGRQRKSIWLQIAAFVRKHKLYFPEYLYFVFMDWKPLQMPAPNHVLSQKVLAEYRSFDREMRRRGCLYHLKSNMGRLDCKFGLLVNRNKRNPRKVSRTELFRQALLAPEFSGEPLFVYCMAHIVNDQDLVDWVHARAEFQYILQAPYYDAIWEIGLIPSEFKKQARKEYGVVRGRQSKSK